MAKRTEVRDSLVPSAGLEQAFAAALRAAQSVPDSSEAWDHLEELAERLERVEDTAAAYREALAQPLERDVRKRLGQRALRFLEGWFGDDPERMQELLVPFVDGDPGSDWAFERLTRVLSLAERWSALLDLYDRALARTADAAARKKLLDDAAHVAKDFADQPERAIGYLHELHLVDRNNLQLTAALERLLERAERIADLIELWRRQAELASGEEARALRLRIAACYLDRLNDAEAAVTELESLLHEVPGHAGACEQLEGVLARESADAAVRIRAFTLLRTHYDAARLPERAIAAIEQAIALHAAAERRELHRDAAQRLAILKRDAESMAHYAVLLRENASDADARRQLRRLAERSGQHALHAESLIAAAEQAGDPGQRASLLSQAAELRRDALSDTDGAIALFARVLAEPELPRREAVAAARDLAQLFSASERPGERLAILERLAELEPSQAARNVVLSEAALLAESIGDRERALSAWRTRLASNPQDLEALNASVRLLAQGDDAGELVDVLRRRAACALPPELRRADLMAIASVQLERLQDVDAGIATLLEVTSSFGTDEAVLLALDAAMSRADRHAELAELLRKGLSDNQPRAARWLVRLGDILRGPLRLPERALGVYMQALALDGRRADSRQGLLELAQDEAYARSALDALARCYRELGEWASFVALTPARVRSAAGDTQRAVLLVESARIVERELGQPAEALAALCGAFVHDPLHPGLEGELMRLGEQTGDFASVAEAYGKAASLATQHNDVAVRLQYVRARLLETRLGDPRQALSAYTAAFDWVTEDRWGERPIDPSPRTLLHAVARCAAGLGTWAQATEAVVHACAMLGAEESEMLARLETETSARDAWSAMVERFRSALDRHRERLPTEVRCRLELRVALWYRHRVGDLGAAEALALRALDGEQSRSEARTLLCDIQRHTSSPALVGTLLQLDALNAADALTSGSRNLDLLYEAAQRVLAQDRPRAAEVLLLLYQESARLWSRGAPATGEHSPAACAGFAVEQLVELDLELGRVERAVQLLLDASKLPVTPEESRNQRARAAALLTERGQGERAIALYQALVEEAPSEIGWVRDLSALLERHHRLPELVSALRRELELQPDPERLLALRLTLAELLGEIEQDDGRVHILRDNLQQAPGHSSTVEALSKLMLARGRARELAQLLSEQAAALEQREARVQAAALWGRAADLFEQPIGDIPAAIAANERVVALDASPARVATLAKLYLAQQMPAKAAKWLAWRLEHTEAQDRLPLLLQLARAELQAEQNDAAVRTLAAAFAEAPRNAEVRKLLLQQHRARGDHAALASTLSKAAEHVTDGETVIAYAREAADLYRVRLGRPDLATDVLARALEFAPGDRSLGLMLAEAKLAAGHLEDAEALLIRLIEGFGARRSPERAIVHLTLARVLHTKQAIDGALDQLDIAQKMDGSNIDAVRMLAELARDAGQNERSERAYRALLLIVRELASSGQTPAIGPGEVLMQLSFIAADLGQPERATERCESALEAMVKSEDDGRRVQAAVLARGDLVLARRVLEMRQRAASGTEQRAAIAAEYAALLQGPLADREASFERWLEAVELHPAAPQYHAATLALARDLGAVDRYAALLGQLVERTNTPAQSYARCEVLLRLGELAESDDPGRASELYAAAEATGVREVDVWRAQAACAATRGDRALQLELLTRLATMGEQQSGAESRADALYRLAEVQLAHESSVSEGVESLARALDEDPRNERAGRIIERVCRNAEPTPELLALYERVARGSQDPSLLLGFLERQARRDDALPEEIREAVLLAQRQDRAELADELMLRAVEIAQELPDGNARVEWALVGLADRRCEQGDLAAVVKWLLAAAESASPDQVLPRAAKLAELAMKPGGDLTLAAKLYEHLLQRNPTTREVWEPLAAIYAALGDLGKFERLVEETLDSLDATSDRNQLRLQHARLLADHGGDLGQATEILRELLVEDPRHAEAQALLLEVIARAGTAEDLLELLEQQLSQAQARSDGPAVRAAALRLGEHLRSTGALADEADVYREALPWVAGDRELASRLLARLTGDDDSEERAKLLESLLDSDSPEEAAAHALAAAALHERRGDAAGLLRVLERGLQRAQGHADLTARLERAYRDAGDHAGLVRLLQRRAEQETAPHAQAQLLLEAALLYRDQLSQADRATALLEQAAEIAPHEIGISRELAQVHSMAGRPDLVVERLGRALAHAEQPVVRGELLRLRAGALQAVGDGDGSLRDLEEAFALDPQGVAPALESALEERRRAARTAHDVERERAATLRLVDALVSQQKVVQARKALSEWIARVADDVPALQRQLELCESAGDSTAAAESALRIVHLTDGEAQLAMCGRLVETATRIERFDLARSGLEAALAVHEGRPELRSALRDVYERTQAYAELARMLLEDASRTDKESELASLLKQAGQYMLAGGQTEQALHTLRDALTCAPADAELLFLLVDAYIDARDLATADALLDDALPKLTGRRLELHQHARRKARLAEAAGDRKVQLAWLTEASKHEKDPHLVLAIADLAEALEDWDAAEKALRNVLLSREDSPIGRSELYVRQARVWMVRGDNKRALMLARKAQKEAPDSAQVITLLRQLGAA